MALCLKAQTKQLESVQKTAFHIILNFSQCMPYLVMLSAANLTTLASHRKARDLLVISLSIHSYQTLLLLSQAAPDFHA